MHTVDKLTILLIGLIVFGMEGVNYYSDSKERAACIQSGGAQLAHHGCARPEANPATR